LLQTQYRLTMKLLIVRSSQFSSWGSCKVISPNLQLCYQQLSSSMEISWFDFPMNYIQSEINDETNSIHELAKAIIQHKPDQLVFIDHLPCPAEILSKLFLVLDQKKIPPVTIHLYGDFTYFSNDWLDLSSKILNHPVRFIAASAAQKKLVQFFCDENTNLEQFCFPVKPEEYFFDAKARTELRKNLKIENNDIVLLYSGRISLQKNVELLIHEYFELIKDESANVHLWIAGAFDDLGAPFMGLVTSEGYLYTKIQNILKQYPRHLSEKVKFWGQLDKTELRKVQSAADMFVSFSLYHDEDFGMSPAEALACGLPSLLTDWGGYSSFASTKWRCKLAPVKITQYGLEIKTKALKDFFELQKQSYVEESDRQRWSKEFLQEFSVESAADKLREIYKKPVAPFAGFNWALAPFAKIYSKPNRNTTIDPNACPSDKNFYEQVYRNYISGEDQTQDHFKVVNWTYDYILNSQQDPAMPVSRKMRPNHFYLKPFSNDYIGPHNPVLLGGYITKKLMNRKMWTLRDGLIPLTFFFKEHAPETGVHYAVPAEFRFVVPEHWRNNILFYEIKAKSIFSRYNLPKKILVCGMQDSVFANIDEIKKSMAELKDALGEDALKNVQITAFFPFKKNNLWGKKSDDETFSMAQSLLDVLGPNIEFLTWNTLKNENDFKDCLYYEVNQNYFIADSFLKHFALSKGAGLIEKTRKPYKEVSSFQLSPYHSVHLYTPEWSHKYYDPFEDNYFSYFKELCTGELKSVRISPNWESWYPLFLKKFYKLNPPVQE